MKPAGSRPGTRDTRSAPRTGWRASRRSRGRGLELERKSPETFGLISRSRGLSNRELDVSEPRARVSARGNSPRERAVPRPRLAGGHVPRTGTDQREIAERCAVSPRTIRTYVKEFGIPTREVRGRNHGLYGRERDEETRRKISDAFEDRDITPEWRKRISEALTCRTVPTDVRERIADSLTGVERSRETRRWTSESTASENPN